MIVLLEDGKEISSLFYKDIIPPATIDKEFVLHSRDGSFTGTLTLKSGSSKDFNDGLPFISFSEDGENWVKSIDLDLDIGEVRTIYSSVDVEVYAIGGSYRAIGELNGTFTHKYAAWDFQKRCNIEYMPSPYYTKLKITLDYDPNYMKGDFGDIRFVKENGDPLKYIILNMEPNQTATFLVEIGTDTFYILSGNSEATPEEDYSFLEVYDDLWDVIEGTASYDTIDGKTALKLESGTLIKSKNEIETPYEIRADVYFSDESFNILYSQDSTPNPNERWNAVIGSHNMLLLNGQPPEYPEDYNKSSDPETWHNVVIDRTASWGFTYLYVDGEFCYGVLESQWNKGYIGLSYNGENYAGVRILGYQVPDPGDVSITFGDWEANDIVTDPINVDININCYFTVTPESINTPPSPTSIEVLIDGKRYTDLISSFTISKSTKEAPGTFDIIMEHDGRLYLFTGMEVEFRNWEIPFYKGKIQRIEYEIQPGHKRYYISGRDASDLLSGFQWSAYYEESYTPEEGILHNSYDILNSILEGTDIELGPSVDITAMISDNNNRFAGFAGSWDSKAKAIDELLKKVSYVIHRKLGWYIDSNNKLRIFYTDEPDNDMAIQLKIYDNPRLTSISIEENAENIINNIVITTEQSGRIEVKDEESINGWIDYDTGLQRPGYGVQKREYNEYSIDSAEAEAKAKQELDTYSKPIFNTKLTLEGIVDANIGQPLLLLDYSGRVFPQQLINKVRYSGKPSGVTTEILATTDKNVIGAVDNYDAIRALSRSIAQEYAIYTGRIVAGARYPNTFFGYGAVFLNELNATIHVDRIYYMGSWGDFVGSEVFVWRTKDGKWAGIGYGLVQ